jgi:hypothetical protein
MQVIPQMREFREFTEEVGELQLQSAERLQRVQ